MKKSLETELYESGLSLKEISEQINMSPVGIWKRLKKQKIKMRKGGVPNKYK